MARTLHDAKLDTRTARAKLAIRREPYWRSISQGMAIGYRKGIKGGTWIARLYSLRTGRRYEALGVADDVADADGVHVLSFAQAQERARVWFGEVAAGGEPDATTGAEQGPYTVRAAVKDYLAAYGAGQTRGGGKALTDTKTRIGAFILPQLGDKEAAKLDAQTISRWFAGLAAAPPRVRSRKGAAPKYRAVGEDPESIRRRRATANRTLTILKAVLNHAFQNGKVASDTAWRQVKPFHGADAPRLRYLDHAECKRLANAAGRDFRPMVQAALLTGCRYGELAALNVADFHQPSGTVFIATSKSGKPRRVVLTNEGQAFFAAVTVGKPGSAIMFPRPDGNRWGKSHQSRPMFEACKAASISPPVSFHALRHTYASLLVMAGVPLPVVAQNLGHADTRMVERHYGHLAPSYIAETIRAKAPKFGIVRRSNVARLDGAARRRKRLPATAA